LRTLILVDRPREIPSYMEPEDRYSMSTRLATRPNGDVLQFMLIEKGDAWLQRLCGQIFDTVEGLERLTPEQRDLVKLTMRRIDA